MAEPFVVPGPFVIRPARPADLPAVLAIFNDLIATSTAVYTETPVSLSERTEWFASRVAGGFPVLVAEGMADGGASSAPLAEKPYQQMTDTSISSPAILGYASFGPFRGSWPGYRQTVEHSVHVRAGERGRGIGSALIRALLDEARARDVHVMVGAIDAENKGSLRLHARLGFVETGRMPQVGRKFGRWLDLVFMQRFVQEWDA